MLKKNPKKQSVQNRKTLTIKKILTFKKNFWILPILRPINPHRDEILAKFVPRHFLICARG